MSNRELESVQFIPCVIVDDGNSFIGDFFGHFLSVFYTFLVQLEGNLCEGVANKVNASGHRWNRKCGLSVDCNAVQHRPQKNIVNLAFIKHHFSFLE